MSEAAVLSIVPKAAATAITGEVVKQLRALLEEAERGEILGIAVVLYDRQKTTTQTVVPGDNPTLLLGGLAGAQARLARAIG